MSETNKALKALRDLTTWGKMVRIRGSDENWKQFDYSLAELETTLTQPAADDECKPWVFVEDDGAVQLEIRLTPRSLLIAEFDPNGSIDAAIDTDGEPILPIMTRDIGGFIGALTRWWQRTIAAEQPVSDGEKCSTCGDSLPCAKAKCTIERLPVINDPAVSDALVALENDEPATDEGETG